VTTAAPELLDLADRPLAELLDDLEPGSPLEAVVRRLFDPRDRELLTVSAFASSL